jgi:hypothetical protein
MKRLLTSNSNWTTLAKQNTAHDLFCVGASLKQQTIQSPFWKCVLNAWSEFNDKIEVYTVENISSQPLWHNSKINIEYIPS